MTAVNKLRPSFAFPTAPRPEYLDGVLGPAGVADANSNAIIGHGLSFLVGRLSYTFGLQGPCVSTDTACSSSLVALHMAHAAISRADAAAGLAGGVNIMLTPQTTARICLLQALSPVGRCQTFDASADGYGRGEAVALALLQDPALAAQHSSAVLGFVHGAAVNQDGRSSSLTAPNGPAQTALVQAAQSAALASAAQLASVSLHGTGTPLGDPIEVGALGSALGHSKTCDALRVMSLGSSKSCYGHTEGTAGLTGTLLAALMLQQHLLPPIINLRELNPYVSTALGDWSSRQGLAPAPSRQLGALAQLSRAARGDMAVLAGTSSFGMSGVNAHALLSAADLALQQQGISASTLVLQRSSFWPAPLGHPLMHAAAVSGGPGTARRADCSVDLSAPSLSWLQDHRVQGHALLPAAAMFELAAAGVVACLTNASALAGERGLQALAIQAPCMLPSPDARTSPASLLQCSIDSHSGALEVLGSARSKYLSAEAAHMWRTNEAAGRNAGVLVEKIGLRTALIPAQHLATPHRRVQNFASVGCQKEEAAG